MNSFEKKLCSWYKCSELGTHTSKHNTGDPLCDFHHKGGMFGTGTSFDTYSMIEEDFLNIIKIIPLEKESLNVFSPKLSDIILRVGSNIDIFFNEWIKVPEFNDSTLVKKVRKQRNKTIKDYYNIFFNHLKLNNALVAVRHIEANIYPFKNWTIDSSPSWWKAYNKKGAIHLAQVAPICCGSYVAVSRWYRCNCLVHKLIRKPAFPKV